MFRDAKVGDKVWRPVKGEQGGEWGKIVDTEFVRGLEIRAIFDGTVSAYSLDGHKGGSRIGFPDLFWGPVELPELPSRPKQKVRKTIETWCNVYREDPVTRDRLGLNYNSEQEAMDAGSRSYGYISTIKLTGEYFVEE